MIQLPMDSAPWECAFVIRR